MDLADRIASWALSERVSPLPSDEVPGTNDDERRGLAALGGLAGALAGTRIQRWPPQLREWANTAQPPRDLLDAVQRELSGGTDVLAAAYEALVSGRNRRRLGTFFTPPAVVEFMLDRAERRLGTPAIVIDPGAGVGAFSMAAKRRWPKSQVLAVDVNVVTLGLLAAREDARIDLVHEDFLSWATSARAPSKGPRLWIGNPPYTRHQELTADLKERAIDATGGMVVSRRAGLSAYFLAATLVARRPDDVICYLLPGTWLDTGYGAPLRRAVLQSQAGSIEMYGFRTDDDLFPGTRVAAMMLVLGQDEDDQTFTTQPARLTAGAVQLGRSSVRDRAVAGQRFGRWVWPQSTGKDGGHTPLKDVAQVRRGVATGANRFFFLTDQQRARFPTRATVRGILRLRNVPGSSLTSKEHDDLGDQGERRWLLVLREPDLLHDAAIIEWLEAAREARIHERYLPMHREPWYSMEVVDPPDVLVGPMSKGRIRAVVNEVAAVPSNAIYGLYLNGRKDLAVPLTAWLNGSAGQQALRAQARTYGGGLVKLEPSDLGAVLIPEPEELMSME